MTDKAEQTLKAQHLLDTGIIGILYWNIAGGITDANDTFLELMDTRGRT